MKKIWIAIAATLLCLGLPAPASAATIDTIDIDARIQADGSVVITDSRVFEAYEGTEHYISIQNLGESDVKDFRVTLDGQQLTDVGEWDVYRSLEDKAGQSGVVTLEDGYELAFGFGEYGKHTADMTYTVTNFVYNLQDGAQAVYWEFIPRNMTSTNEVKIRLTNDVGFSYTQENSRVWGFGYSGSTEITGDALTMTTSQPIGTSNYMTMLAIFPDAPFTSSVSLPHDSQSLEELAKEGSIWEDGDPGDPGAGDPGAYDPGAYDGTGDWQDEGSSETNAWPGLAIGGAAVAGMAGVGLLGVRGHRKTEAAARAQGLYKLGQKPTIGREDYWRDIPFNGPITDIFKISGDALPDLATALLLEWVREGALVEVKHEAGWIFKREEAAFQIMRSPTLYSKVELDYWNFILRASGEDGVLQRKEIERFTRRNTREVTDWQEAADEHSYRYLVANGFVQEFQTKRLGLFSTTQKRLTARGMDLKNRIEGLKNYLRDFSLLNERGASNVLLWDQYMIWAGYLGIAEEVAKQFNIVDPAYYQQTYLSDSAVVTGYYFSTGMHNSYASATSSSSSGFSGGGGMSSIGGGGGSFGGGGGGGGIR